MQLADLNRKYYELYDELFRAQRVLTEKQFDVMSKTLLQQYVEELDVSVTERLLEVGEKTFELKFKSHVYVPRRKLFGYNKIGKRLMKQYKADFLAALQKLEKDFQERQSTDKSAAPSTALTPVKKGVTEAKNDEKNV